MVFGYVGYGFSEGAPTVYTQSFVKGAVKFIGYTQISGSVYYFFIKSKLSIFLMDQIYR